MKKVLTSVRSFIQSGAKPKFCADCCNLAAQEASFKVDESATIIDTPTDV